MKSDVANALDLLRKEAARLNKGGGGLGGRSPEANALVRAIEIVINACTAPQMRPMPPDPEETISYDTTSNRSVADRITKDIDGLTGDNVQSRVSAIIEAHLNTIRPHINEDTRDRTQAWCVMWLDTDSCPPKVIGGGVYSESSPTSMHGEFPVVAIEMEGRDYDQASRKMGELLQSNRHYKWLDDLVHGRFDKEKVFKIRKGKKRV